jgi:prophage tail gpP-like protein
VKEEALQDTRNCGARINLLSRERNGFVVLADNGDGDDDNSKKKKKKKKKKKIKKKMKKKKEKRRRRQSNGSMDKLCQLQ